MPLPPSFEARLVRARPLAPTVRELTFERADGQPMEFEPGQWVSAYFAGLEPPAEETKRSYSIASAPDGSPRFDLAVTRVQDGPASTRLHTMEPGAALRFQGPQGFFTRGTRSLKPLPEDPAMSAPALMIATGTGVTPMRSMLQASAAQGPLTPVILVLGVRHEADLLYGDEFRALAQAHTAFRFVPTLSQPGPGWDGRRGYVQTHVRELWQELAAGGAAPHAYVCGLERMVGSVREMLRKEMGVPRQQVHSERYD
jgi:ferredoxin-NADP reductase